MLTKILRLVLFFAFLCAKPAAALLDFPLGTAAKVNQTYGDFNGSHYHDGIDLPGISSQVVISPVTGKIITTPRDIEFVGQVCIKESTTGKIWAFGHIKPESNLVYGSTIAAGVTWLGILQNFPRDKTKPRYYHLHIAISPYADWRCYPGMYNYAIEAGKAGRKLTKGGMFAVLR